MKDEIKIFESSGWDDYELLDTGEGEKLERFGKYSFIRPYEDAVWKKALQNSIWQKAEGRFVTSREAKKSGWDFTKKIDKNFVLGYKDIKWNATPTPFRHLGFFPEQRVHWDFIYEKINKAEKPIKFLNLFGYTGVASLFALKAGADVTHLDASKQSLNLAKENQKISGLENLPMRFILDDAVKFLEREIKRGNKYDCVIMDPPKFGRGSKGEVWKIESGLPKLLSLVRKVLSDKPLFVILTSYANDTSSLSLGYALKDSMEGLRGEITQGEICIKEKSTEKDISLARTAVWVNN